MFDTELYLTYDPAILILVTTQTPGPIIRRKLEFVDSFTKSTKISAQRKFLFHSKKKKKKGKWVSHKTHVFRRIFFI